MYLLGNLTAFMFSGVNITPAIIGRLDLHSHALRLGAVELVTCKNVNKEAEVHDQARLGPGHVHDPGLAHGRGSRAPASSSRRGSPAVSTVA